MENTSDALCEKIINEIDVVFNKNPSLAAFEIIPTSSNQNKSPVVHIDNNLGLESWCIKHVYEYSHKLILENKFSNGKHIHNVSTLTKYLNAAILINPDVAMFWNMRRHLVGRNKLKINKEFQFSGLVLSKKPKSCEAFAYRRWLHLFLSGESIDLTFEISLCERCADKNSSNYHAWSHRLWVLEQEPKLLRFEYNLTEKFIRRHISDYSCYHHRSIVLRKLLEVCFNEPDETDNRDLKELIDCLLGVQPETTSELLSILLPDLIINPDDLLHYSNHQFRQQNKINSFIYCMNLAAYDLKLVADLKDLFGDREAFEQYRRSVLQFIVNNCLLYNSSVNNQESNINNWHQPMSKLFKRDNREHYKFINALLLNEAKRGELNKKWCQLFLGYTCDDNIES